MGRPRDRWQEDVRSQSRHQSRGTPEAGEPGRRLACGGYMRGRAGTGLLQSTVPLLYGRVPCITVATVLARRSILRNFTLSHSRV